MTDTVIQTIDVRTLAAGSCRDTILCAVQDLAPGTALQVVVDHDILPMRMLLTTSWPGMFSFKYLEAGPDVWRVEIIRNP